ncbi:MAG: class I SAM-dependent methyltransferase [Treponema sp.]|jgi:SAM-dependent methyltransferase|nr:class I SAM-dependent methyltransferase [Treponema sp.]
MDKKIIRNFRKNAFRQIYQIDENLINLLDKNDKEFDFIRNPVIQNIYNYQVDYLLHFSNEWLKQQSLKILDWGCGKGYVTYLLKKRGINITSCDVSNTGASSAFGSNSLIASAKIHVIKLEQGYVLPFNDSEFDVILSFGVLEHVPDDLGSLCEIKRVLKTNGLFFCFYLPYKLSYTQNIHRLRGYCYHDKLYWKKDVRNLLKKANLNLLDIWHRALLPKISFIPSFYHTVERIDNWLCNYSLLKYFATNIEFVAKKP